jgi:GTP-binding protein Era
MPVSDAEPGSIAPATDAAIPFRSGFVAIIGRVNVGKSLLLNQLVGQKLAIVTPKPHTTRHRLLGVLNGEAFQAGLLDTPGFLAKGRDQLDASMSRQTAAALAEADLVVLVVEPRPPGDVERHFMAQLLRSKKPSILVVNKVDLVRKSSLLPVLEEYAVAHQFREIVPISALEDDGLDLLVELVRDNLPIQEALFPSEMLTDRSVRFLAGELIREKVFLHYSMEVPYSVAVEVEEFEEREGDKPDYVRAIIYVDKPSQRPLLIGHGGSALKEVSIEARQEIEELVGRPVFVELWVKVNPQWRRKAGFIQRTM